MYICICNQITDTMLKADPRHILKCGTNCGKCIPYIEKNIIPGTDKQIYSESELIEAYEHSRLGGQS